MGGGEPAAVIFKRVVVVHRIVPSVQDLRVSRLRSERSENATQDSEPSHGGSVLAKPWVVQWADQRGNQRTWRDASYHRWKWLAFRSAKKYVRDPEVPKDTEYRVLNPETGEMYFFGCRSSIFVRNWL